MRGKVALVTGSEGFVGRVLCAHLKSAGVKVLGCDLVELRRPDGYKVCNLSDDLETTKLLDWTGRCDYVFHLAAAASVSGGIHAPGHFMRANIEGTANLCDALRNKQPWARLIFIGSSEVYGPPQRLPLDETHPVNPMNPYAISKLAAEQYCRYMHAAYGLNVGLLRPFNHSGPGQREQFVLSSFARQIVEIEKGLREPVLRVGNLSAKRDFSHVEDVVRAYLLVAEMTPTAETYNVCSGQAIEIGEALEKMRSFTPATFTVETDPDRYRPVDVPEICGSYAKINAQTGWQPELGFDRILEDLMDYWREQL